MKVGVTMKNYSTLRALSTKDEPVIFDISDVPMMMDEEHFVLVRREGSPILRVDTVVLGTDIEGVFEGSRIVDNQGKEYTVSYKRGFAAMDASRKIFKLNSIAPFIYKEVNISATLSCRARIIFKCDDRFFQLRDVVGEKDGFMIIKNNYSLIDPNNIQQFAGMSNNNQRLFLGDNLYSGTVCMRYGRICLYDGNKYVDLVDGEVIV